MVKSTDSEFGTSASKLTSCGILEKLLHGVTVVAISMNICKVMLSVHHVSAGHINPSSSNFATWMFHTFVVRLLLCLKQNSFFEHALPVKFPIKDNVPRCSHLNCQVRNLQMIL